MAGEKPGKKIGFALGGGAARGLAHVGVVRTLMKEGIRPDVITGTSIGAVIGAMFAVHADADAVVEVIREYNRSNTLSRIRFDLLADDEAPLKSRLASRFLRLLKKGVFYGLSLTRRSLVPAEEHMINIARLIPDISFSETKIPLAVIATDLKTGEEVVITEGRLRSAVAASSAIPGIFPPVEVDGKTLIDGGWVDQLPSGPCRRLGAELVVAVDVARDLERRHFLLSALDIMSRATAITRHALTRLRLKEADVIIGPEVADLSWTDFRCMDICFAKGEAAAMEALPRIRELLTG